MDFTTYQILTGGSAARDYYEAYSSNNADVAVYYHARTVTKVVFCMTSLSLSARDDEQLDNGIPLRRRTMTGLGTIACAAQLSCVVLTNMSYLPSIMNGIFHGIYECTAYQLLSRVA